MPHLRLTAEIAFKAAHELVQEGEQVNSNTLWMRCQGVGSRGTAKKWAETWNAFERREKVQEKLEKFRSVYDAVKQGEGGSNGGGELQREGGCVFLEDEAIPQVEGAIGELGKTLSAIVYELVEEKTHELATSCADVVRKAHEQKTEAKEELSRVTEELKEAKIDVEAFQHRCTLLVRQNEALALKHEELGKGFTERGEHIEKLHAKVAEVSEERGVVQAKLAELVKVEGELKEKFQVLNEKNALLTRDFEVLRDEKVEIAQHRSEIQVELNQVRSQLQESRSQCQELREEVRALNALLVEKEGKACTALEKARQLQAQLQATKEELSGARALAQPQERSLAEEKEEPAEVQKKASR